MRTHKVLAAGVALLALGLILLPGGRAADDDMDQRTAAVAAVAHAAAPQKAAPDKDPKDWKKYSEDMIKTSQEFAKAVETKKLDAIKKAATNLNATCSDCHSKFRD